MTDTIQQVKLLIREAVEFGRAGDKASARQKLEMAKELDSTQPDIWYLLAYFADDPREQYVNLEQALRLNPQHERSRQLMEQVRPRVERVIQPPAATADEPDFGEAFGLGATQPSGQPTGGRTPPQPPRQQPSAQAGAQMSAAAKQIGTKVADGLSGEKGRGLVRAWLAALSFDEKNSYEAYRGKVDPLFTALLMLGVFALVPFLVQLVSAIAGGAMRDFGGFLGGLVRTLLGGVLLGTQVTLSFYVASFVSAYIARIQFKSDVKATEHFALGGLYFVPAGIAFGVLSILMTLLSQVLARLLTFEGRLLVGQAVAWTSLVFFGYLMAQFVYSNIAIHRVNTWRGIIISLVSAAMASLVFMWLLPITLPLLAG